MPLRNPSVLGLNSLGCPSKVFGSVSDGFVPFDPVNGMAFGWSWSEVNQPVPYVLQTVSEVDMVFLGLLLSASEAVVFGWVQCL